ncbi:MAG: hypothetical protein ACI4SY_05570 [Sutterella sp.]
MKMLFFVPMLLSLASPAHAAATVAPAAAINLSNAEAELASHPSSPPGCANCHEPVYPIRVDRASSILNPKTGLAGWETEEIETPIGLVFIHRRQSGKLRLLYEFQAIPRHGEIRFYLPAEGASPHNLE